MSTRIEKFNPARPVNLRTKKLTRRSKSSKTWTRLTKRITDTNEKQIKLVINELGNKKIPVQDFVTLISPYTADGGAGLRSVFDEDFEKFRKTCYKIAVQKAMTDEHVASIPFYSNKHDLMTKKMVKIINKVLQTVPDFDFDKYWRFGSDYLQSAVLALQLKEGDLRENLRRLKNDCERLTEENRRLQYILDELKMQQKLEQTFADEIHATVEAKRIQLELEEVILRQQLNQLNENIERYLMKKGNNEY